MLPASSEIASRRAVCIASIVLALCTVALYFPVTHFDFIGYDDPLYVTQNPHVRDGLTPHTFLWAFRLGPGHAVNYHPLTWLSHLLDIRLYGLHRPGMHHLSSVLLHAAAGVALLWFLVAATGRLAPSAGVAVLFAVHPMHVESVAWISERKDVLSALFFFLTLLAYVRYARADEQPPGKRAVWYAVVIVLYALGLLAKPMLVTTPFVMLLVDAWPLRRSWRVGLIIEKLPLLVMAAAESWITYRVQIADNLMRSADALPLSYRLANVPVAYVRYLGKLFWPGGLSVFYPYRVWNRAQVTAAVIVLVIITIGVLLARRRRYLAVGWLWFGGMLVPVIGFVQVGQQSMADRYSYLPSVGLFILVCFGVDEWATTLPRRHAVLTVAIGLVCVLAIVTERQLQYWRDELTLFTHAADVTDDNFLAHGFIGKALAARGDIAGAFDEYQRALEINPNYYEVHYNLGSLDLRTGQLDEATRHLRRAIELRPQAVEARNNLAIALAEQKQLSAAAALLREAIDIDPDYAEVHATLGRVLLKQGNRAAAEREFRRAIELDPTLPAAQRGIAETGHDAVGTTRP